MGMVPSLHVMHDCLRSIELQWKEDSDKDAPGSYRASSQKIYVNVRRIETTGDFPYTLDGDAAPLPALQAVVLHEIGHSVDAKAKIMTGAAISDEALGGWAEPVKPEDLADALVAELNGVLEEEREQVEALVLVMVKGENLESLASLSEPVQEQLQELAKKLAERREDKTHWRSPQWIIGDRCYIWNSCWVSYSLAAYQALTVRDYQWRAPAEWFAELYTVSWSLRRAIPGAPPHILPYLYREDP